MPFDKLNKTASPDIESMNNKHGVFAKFALAVGCNVRAVRDACPYNKAIATNEYGDA